METDLPGRIKQRFQRLETWLLDLDVLQWALPIFLAVTAIAFELVEHIQKDEMMDAGFIGELIIFGFMGPIIIRGLIVWMRNLMSAERRTSAEIQALNRDLEKKVNERTAALEQRNDELGRLNRELRDLDEMKSDFVALVSHELRAPLTALNGGLELALQSAESLSPRSRAVLEIMEDESKRLTDFVQTILDVSRLMPENSPSPWGRLLCIPWSSRHRPSSWLRASARSSGISRRICRRFGEMKPIWSRRSGTSSRMPISTPLPISQSSFVPSCKETRYASVSKITGPVSLRI
jgi:signal transduction histidine kinase